MIKTRLFLTLALVGASCTVYAMGHKIKEDQQDAATFDAKAVGTTPDTHISDATAEKKPVGLPASPADVEKDTARDFNDPFFKESAKDKDPDFDTGSKK